MSYVYESLDFSTEQIRLLTLAPAGNETADIYCNLQTLLLRDRPEYEALSYTWGDTSQECTTYMDGYPFEVTPNLDIALRHLRHPFSPCVLWIDAICINQANVRERNHEVSRMRNIYYHASQVLVWLGESDEDITKAMNFLVGLKDNGDGFKIPKDKTLRAAVTPGLVKIMKKPWWSRIWVVQEFTVAKYYPLVGCGQTWVSWEVFNSSIRTLGWEWISADVDDFPNTDMIFIFSFEDLRNSWRHRSEAERPTLRELLISTDDRDATDPRDHVFAILGLTTEVGDGGILPDYEQTVDLVYKRAMINLLRSSKDLELLVAAVGE